MPHQRFSLTTCISLLSLVLAVAAKSKKKKVSSLIRRIIAGVVIAVVGLFVLTFVCCWLMTRRRRARGAVAGEINPGHSHQASTGPLGPAYSHASTTQLYNSEYPVGDALPAPAYEKDSHIPAEGGYPPTGAPGNQHHIQGGFASPLGPPPPAHTAGQDGAFVGGFKA